MGTWYWSADSLFWQVSIDHYMKLYMYINKVHSKPGQHVYQPIINRATVGVRGLCFTFGF